MIIYIHDNRLLSDLQERFSKCFPSLKIEFYSKQHSLKNATNDSYRINPERTIGEIRKNHNEGEFVIKSWNTVEKVEKDFRDKFGLNVQIFRNENAGWVQTSKTDRFSLRDQQEMTCHSASSLYPLYPEQLGEYGEL
jgi:hypothetical protein